MALLCSTSIKQINKIKQFLKLDQNYVKTKKNDTMVVIIHISNPVGLDLLVNRLFQ